MSNFSTNALSTGRSELPEEQTFSPITASLLAEAIREQANQLLEKQSDEFEAKFLLLQNQIHDILTLISAEKSGNRKGVSRNTDDSSTITSTNSDINLIQSSIESSSVLADDDLSVNISDPPKIEHSPSFKSSKHSAEKTFNLFERTNDTIRKSQKRFHESWRKLPKLNDSSVELWSRALQELNSDPDYKASFV